MQKVLNSKLFKYLITTSLFVIVAIFSIKSNNLSNLTNRMNSSLSVSSINIGTNFYQLLGNIFVSSSSITLVKNVDLIPNSTNVNDMKKNTKNLQLAIDTMSDSGGGTVYLPSGTYYFYQGGASPRGEKYAIRCRNNVALIGAGTNENSSSKSTILKPYYNNSSATGGMDMFYFNNYSDTGYNTSGNVTPSTKRDVTYKDIDGKIVTLKNQTVYLINADFKDFVIDGAYAKGGIASCGGSYQTDGKGFMINLFKDCDWDNIVVKNTDATGFGVDCPINSTINNCKAINCGKAATTNSEGASGFGIGSGYSNDESIIITNSVAINNKKFGFFFEHQARFSNYYPATTSKGFVVANSIAGGNLYDFGGLKTFNLTFENVKSISGKGTYSNSNLNQSKVSSGSCGYTSLNYNSNSAIKLNTNRQPIYFSLYSVNNYMINATVSNYLTDVTSYETEITWAVNKGLLSLTSSTKFSPSNSLSRFEAIGALWKYNNMPGTISTTLTSVDIKNYQSKVLNIGYTDLGSTAYKNDLDAIVWAYNKGIISKDTKFNPSNDCTRAQFVVMLYRMTGSPNVSGTVPFSDVKSTDWYYKAVLWGYKVGIVKGSELGTFLPNNSLKKNEAAIFLYRYDKNVRKNYTIKYNLLGGTGSNITSYTSSSLPYTLKAPTRSGYTFVGWTGSNGATASKNVKIAKGTKGDLVYTANWKKIEVTLSKISIKTKPSKLIYNIGDKIDTTGLTITATYSDSSTKTINSGYTVSPTILTSAGTKTVTVKYGGKTTTYTITVKDSSSAQNPISLTKISIKTKPGKLTYNIGDTVDTTGLTITATYSDSSTKTISSGYTVSPTTLTSAGTKTVTVKYGGKTTTYTIKVNDISLSKISIKTKPKKLVYYVGDTIDTTGLTITATYSDSSTKTISSGYTISPTTLTSAGTKTVTVKYGEKTTTYTIKVNDVSINSISVKTLPHQTTYYVGDTFSGAGLTLLVSYNNGYVQEVTNGYTLSISEKTVLDKAGEIKVTVSYNKYQTSFDINVLPIKDNNLIILSKPNKTIYLLGEQFDTTGLALETIDDSGNRVEITSGYTLSLNNRTILNNDGVITVVVTYKDKTAQFDIEVLKVKKLTVKENTVRLEYKIGESFDSTGLILIVEYTNGNKEEISAGYKIQGGEKFKVAGSETITIRYGNTKTELEVEVLDEEIKNDIEQDKEEVKEDNSKKDNKLRAIHIIIITIFGLSITLLFEYKRTH